MFILPKKFYTQNFGMVLALIICLYSTQSYADVCFLPLGGCVAGDALSTPENCAGYSAQKKNERGWNCATCNANGHTYYKCEEKPCGAGYTAGIESCSRGFTHEYEKDSGGKYVYSGDKKCGKCTTPDGCADGTQLSPVCGQSGFKPVETQNYKGAQVCYACLDDNCYGGKRKYCSWSSGSQSGPSGSVRAKSKEWYTSTARTKYGSTCYQCCNNVCSRGSQEVTSCNPNTELLRTLEHTKCGSACNECCNNQCSVGSLSSSCPSGYYSTTSGSTKCGNTCYSCIDCGGYKSRPSGCYSCTSRSCGGETRYDCTALSDSCPSGSKSVSCAFYETKTHVSTTDCGNYCYACTCTNDSCSSGELNPSCSYGKSNAGKTHCSNRQCYTCNACSDSCSSGSKNPSCSYGKTKVGSTQCGSDCYTCNDAPETCPSGYSEGTKTGDGWYTTVSTPKGTKNCYKLKSCTGDYLPYGAITTCSSGKTLVCDGGKSGNSDCCHCVKTCPTGYSTSVKSCTGNSWYKTCSGSVDGVSCCKCADKCATSNCGGWKATNPGEGWICCQAPIGGGYCCHH